MQKIALRTDNSQLTTARLRWKTELNTIVIDYFHSLWYRYRWDYDFFSYMQTFCFETILEFFKGDVNSTAVYLYSGVPFQQGMDYITHPLFYPSTYALSDVIHNMDEFVNKGKIPPTDMFRYFSYDFPSDNITSPRKRKR